MTRYFEVYQRDGAARKGRLLLSRTIETPYVLKTETLKDNTGPIVDAGSLWEIGNVEKAEHRLEQLRREIGDNRLIILPHMCLVPDAPDCIPESLEMLVSNTGATGRVYREGRAQKAADLYILEGAAVFENNARALLEKVLDMKDNMPDDTALYLPGICLPENLAMLVYIGADVLDTTKATVAAYKDMYLTHAGSFRLASLSELPCRCSTCASITADELKNMDKTSRSQMLEKHNINAMEAELALVREKISSGNLREYVDGQCRTRPWLTALLRLLDREYQHIERGTPITRNVEMLANSGDSLTRPEVVRFARRIQERYTPPELDVLLLLPCSAKKPYSISQSHQKFGLALGKYRKFVHEVIITSPLGIVPRELELTYPAAHYDVAVTGHWDAEEMKWVSECLEDYLSKHRYAAIVAHVDGAYKQICEMVADKLGLEIHFTNTGSVTSHESLRNLSKMMEGLCTGRTMNETKRKASMLRAIADYQFGKGAGEIVVPDNSEIKGPFPRYQSFYEKTQLTTLIPQYGTLAVTIEGAEMMIPRNSCIVRIDDFMPRGSILAPGILEADHAIREGDEVFVVGEKAIGVGRARMNGKEMSMSTRGQAIDLRHVKPK
ncbi:tRNA-guanine transglycosylase [Methanomethylovorans hollandica DSM 15978]|uniref:tRNA-guanine transglycosylase n=1 Tax=Methanomethylovorans hollandica (strain DSM 15978 / NBRC 107637 / DMS1) TaxID=867904 RepID=L0L2N0_METHD|nr:archaeosine synthase subunit alpha [Methanomethylovorans hollandica]AGB50554.1 tRNA-guanine transglycosylase [Methanomethylovorans hollandica DSM 15978]